MIRGDDVRPGCRSGRFTAVDGNGRGELEAGMGFYCDFRMCNSIGEGDR